MQLIVIEANRVQVHPRIVAAHNTAYLPVALTIASRNLSRQACDMVEHIVQEHPNRATDIRLHVRRNHCMLARLLDILAAIVLY